MSKKWITSIIVLAGFAAVVALAGPSAVLSQIVDNDRQKIKVFVGDAPISTAEARATYRAERHTLLRRLAAQQPHDQMSAVLVLGHFVDDEVLASLADEYELQVREVFLAIPNVRGGGGHVLAANEPVPNAIEAYAGAYTRVVEKLHRKAREYQDTPIEDEFRKAATWAQERSQAAQNGRFLVYAARVEGNLHNLQRATEHELVKLVDVFYNEEAEHAADRASKRVLYVPVPERPDSLP